MLPESKLLGPRYGAWKAKFPCSTNVACPWSATLSAVPFDVDDGIAYVEFSAFALTRPATLDPTASRAAKYLLQLPESCFWLRMSLS